VTVVLILGHDLNLRIFTDSRRITHEALSTYHRIGILSLCGRLRDPKIEDKTIDRLRAYASPNAPAGVDCMTCLVNRAQLDAMIARRDVMADPAVPMVQIELRIASWE
jgi:hypothetical protein